MPQATFILLVHPQTGAVAIVRRGDTGALTPLELFTAFVLDGYQPVGPKCRAVADRIRARSAGEPS